jgi:hypothetical protein
MKTTEKTFESWLAEINKYLPCSTADLPDCCYYEWYEDGVTPKVAAKRALKNAEF